ncbi:PP2C family protein-serine/threonine phosphatase [Butyrivibrio sp. XPD2002]|uniref:PP2C family protein-serine/threonine phosphatase n=1 Tax=Butyrivibrio sp. XPD2002 TaxID=1280665 RepID=UPI000478C75C|nr:PP2C family protein-serine/threonine phosphatase [Butyrivibrio sp. XPD2002]
MKKTSGRNKYILVQYGNLFVMAFAVMAVVVAVLALRGFRQQARISESETAYSQAQQTEEYIETFKAYPFLLEYWHEHKDELSESDDVMLEFMKNPAAMFEEFKVSSIYDFTMEDVENMDDGQKRKIALLSYWIAVDHFTFINDTEKDTLDGPMLTTANEDREYCVLINTSENPIPTGDNLIFKQAQKIYNPEKEIEDVDDSIFYIEDNEGGYFTGVLYPVKYEDKLIGLIIIELREAYLKETSFNYTNTLLIIIVFLSFCMCGFLLEKTNRAVIKPITQIQQGLREYTNNLNSLTVISKMRSIKSNNEIGRLADDIAALAERVAKYEEEKSAHIAEQTKIKAELNVANNIQRKMLPDSFPDRDSEKRFDIYGILAPVKEIGGDIYDFFFVDDDHLVLIAADITGNGIPSALFMMEARTLIKLKAEEGKTPSQILTEANDWIIGQNEDNMIISLWMMKIELSTGRALEANAGYENPAYAQGGGKFEFIKNKHSVVLGAVDGATFKETEWKLEPGDKLFVFSDGVIDATNHHRQFFGAEKLLETLNEVNDLDQKEILEHVKGGIDKFIGKVPLFDDLTMMGITYWGSSDAKKE